jgi:Putative Flp pilus-assembly TadE/G-like
MKRAQRRIGCSNRKGDRGQVVVLVLLVLGMFLMAVAAFGVDFANFWFHRQSAQTAADAACTAGAMDMLVDYNTGVTNKGGFTPGTDFNCASGSTIAPCRYAALNGYGSGNAAPGNQVSVSFPTSASVPGLNTSLIPPTELAPTAFIRVDIVDHVQTFFSGLLTGQTTQDVRSFAICGVLLSQSPVPLLILRPHDTSVTINGNPRIVMWGGPTTSVQVNSDSASAIDIRGSSSRIDLSLGGPSNTGSNFGVYGDVSEPSPQFVGGTTGKWQTPQTPVGDPYAQKPAPPQPMYTGGKTPVGPGVHGCPETSGGCDEYIPGYYPSGINVKNATAIFREGIYWVVGGMSLEANSNVRPSTEPAANASDQIGGTMFYFSGTGTISVAANSGDKPPAIPFNATSGSGVFAFGAKCTATSSIPSNLPATFIGSVLLAPCTGTYADPGSQRGILFFQDRSASGVTADWSGGGQALLAGAMYFHHCSATENSLPCGSTPTYYNDTLSMGGNSCAGTYILGNVTTDRIDLSGTPCINMDLNPSASYAILKASLLR